MDIKILMDSAKPRTDFKLASDDNINCWDYLMQITESKNITTEEKLKNVTTEEKPKNITTEEDLKRQSVQKDFIDLHKFGFGFGCGRLLLEDTCNPTSKYQFKDLKWHKPIAVEQDPTDSFTDSDINSVGSFVEDLNESAEYKAKQKAQEISNNDWWLDIQNYDIKKQIIQRGMETIEKPKAGDTCVINIIGSLENGKVVDSYCNHKIFVGDRQISQGIDIALETMHMDECARIKIGPKHNFDKRGKRYDISNDAYVLYMIRLLGIERDFAKKLEKPAPKEPEPLKSSGKIIQMNNRIMMERFFDTHFMQPLKKVSLKKKWYDEINLEQYAIDPLRIYTKIVIAEIIMDDYDKAIKTTNHILTHIDLSNLTVAYLRDALIYITGYDEEPEVTLDKSAIHDIHSRVSPIPNVIYAKIQDIKKIAMELDKNKKQKVELSNKIIWILAIGASVFSFGALINIIF